MNLWFTLIKRHVVGISLYEFTLHSALITHQISQLFLPPSSRRLCHCRQNSDASYTSGKPETAIITLSSMLEDHKELMFAQNFSCHGKKSHPDLQLVAASVLPWLICIKLSSDQHQIGGCGRSGHWHCATFCNQGTRRPLSQVHTENEWQLAAFVAH